ncbi:MAG: translation elongation factor Ts [Candidatus Zixiibacteriota bacterium]|jgi:elongation factor Ts
MAIEATEVKKLRERTGAGMMDCKRALQECGGDHDRAVEYLRVKGLAAAKKKAGRATGEGLIASYIHPGDKLGVLVEINCETDFVARTDEFRAFVKDIAMHVAAADPVAVTAEEFPPDVLEGERNIAAEQAREQGKPDNIIEKIVEGRLKKFIAERTLLEQAYVKDPDKTVREYVEETVAKLGENIVIGRFARFKLGE